jgi:hypothetical protein
MFSLADITNKLARHSLNRYEKDTVVSYYRRWSMSNDIERSRRSRSNQENIPPILKLPLEVLDHCWGYLARPDLLQVPRVCRIFWFTSRYRIFQSLTIDLSPKSSPMPKRRIGLNFKRAKTTPQTLEPASIRLTSFYSDPRARELWDMVQSWTLIAKPSLKESLSLPAHDWQNRVQRMAVGSFDGVCQLLPRSCNLHTLEIVAFDLEREHCAALQSLPALETLKLVGCFFPCPFHFQRQLKLKELAVIGTFCDLPFNIRLVLMLCNPAHLEKLTLTHFFATYSALTSLSFIKDYPRLTHLSIAIKSRSGGLFFRFLGSTPSLATLKILPWSANITPDRPLPALSFFRSYYGYPDLLSHIVPGRPVDCVSLVLRVPTPSSENGSHTDDYAIHVNVIPTLLDISRSAVPVRTLRIEYFLPTLYRLTTIAKHLRDLHHLDLELISASSQLLAVSDMLTCVLCRLVDTLLFPQENITTPSDPSPETCFDRDGNPLDPLDTIQVCRIVA